MTELCRECGRWVPEERVAMEHDGLCICENCYGPDPNIEDPDPLPAGRIPTDEELQREELKEDRL
jgi:hypothetical protein